MIEQNTRRALLTGASGFTGGHLARFLHAQGWHVEVVARSKSIASLLQESGIAYVHAYNGATQELIDAVELSRPSVVFHLAAHVLTAHRAHDLDSLICSNVLFGCQLLEAMRLHGVTALVNAGTSWQSFSGGEYNPTNLYAATKQAFEDIAQFYVETGGLRMLTLRLFDSYGVGDKRGKLLMLLIGSLQSSQRLEMTPGEQVVDLVHIDDLCQAFARAAELVTQSSAPGAWVYAVSGGQRATLKEIVALIESVAGRKLSVNLGARAYRDREVMLPWLGVPLPGWKPRVTLRDGIRSLLASMNVPLL